MAIPTITELSTPPSQADPDNFNTRADTFLGELPTFGTELNASIAEINTTIADVSADATSASTSASNAATSEENAEKWADEDENVEVESGKYSAKHWAKKSEAFVTSSALSSTSGDDLTVISTGTLNLDIGTGLGFVPGMWVTIQNADQSKWMGGWVTSYNSTTGAMAVNIQQSGGTGTGSAWYINVALPTLLPSITAPTLSGVSSATEQTDVTITITNYDSSVTYSASVTGGSTSRTNGVITWTLPDVATDTTLTITVTASKSNYSDSSGSHSLTCEVLNVVGDTDIIYSDGSLTDYPNGQTGEAFIYTDAESQGVAETDWAVAEVEVTVESTLLEVDASSTVSGLVLNSTKTGLLSSGDTVVTDQGSLLAGSVSEVITSGSVYTCTSLTPTPALTPTKAYIPNTMYLAQAASGVTISADELTVDSSSTTSSLVLLSDTTGLITSGDTVITNEGDLTLGSVAESSVTYTLGSWSTGTSLPGPLTYSQVAIVGDNIYLLGGFNDSAYVGTVYTASIASGSIGTWSTGTSLPGALGQSQVAIVGDNIYLLGGYDGSSHVSTVYTASIASGSIGTWSTGTSLPGALGESQVAIVGDNIYLLGGNDGTPVVNTVYYADISSGSIGSWNTGTSLPGALYYSQVAIVGDNIYLLGGANSSTAISTVYTASIASGSIGTWSTGTSLPGALGFSQVAIVGNIIYLLSGFNGSAHGSTVYQASIGSTAVYPSPSNLTPTYTSWAETPDVYEYTGTSITPTISTVPAEVFYAPEYESITIDNTTYSSGDTFISTSDQITLDASTRQLACGTKLKSSESCEAEIHTWKLN